VITGAVLSGTGSVMLAETSFLQAVIYNAAAAIQRIKRNFIFFI
jgi:hypothetical protein